MAKRRKYSAEAFGAAVERLMNETGVTYRALAAKTGLSHGSVRVNLNRGMQQLREKLGQRGSVATSKKQEHGSIG